MKKNNFENKIISVIDPIGGKIGLDDYHFGYMEELIKNNYEVLYFTNSKTRNRNIKNIVQYNTFKNIWENKIKLIKFFFFLRGYFNSVIISKKKKSSIIHFHLFSLNVMMLFILISIKVLTKLKVVATIHDVQSFRTKNSSFIENLFFNFLDTVIVHNNFSKNELLKKINFENIKVIPQGGYINHVSKYPSIKNDNKSLKLLFFGQLKKVKGLDILIHTCNLLKNENFDFQLTIAGRPWDVRKQDILEKINQYNLQENVTLIPEFISDKLKSKLFSECDIVVLPYTIIYNSAVLMLSASYHKPVVVSNLEPFTEIIKHNVDGLVFSNNDHNDLASKLIKLKKDDLQKFSDNLYNKIKNHYSWSNSSKKLIDTYKSLL